tara:strand:+ start:95 stop:283 length:189 start_codon:yes stop_codon:yes gene_type:complete
MMKYKITVDDYVVYEKAYYVEAASKKEAKAKFLRGDWVDCDDSECDYLHKSVVKGVEVKNYD